MEVHWERADDYLSLDLESARRLLGPLGFEPFDLSLITEGKVNTNYRVQTEVGEVLLRLHHGSDAQIALEASLATLLRDRLPVPKLLGRGERCLVFEFVRGRTLESALARGDDLFYDGLARKLARARIALNEVIYAQAGLLGPDGNVVAPWTSAIEGLLGWLLHHSLPESRLEAGLKARVVRIAEDVRPRFEAIAGPPVLVHGDFKPTNLLVDETGLTAVLDWEFAHAGTWLSDVGQLLRHAEGLPPGFEAAFLDELKAPEDAALLARTLDLMNLVDFLAGERDQPTMRADVTGRIEAVCGLYEARFL